MKNSILFDLYHGELRPSERDYPEDSRAGFDLGARLIMEVVGGLAADE